MATVTAERAPSPVKVTIELTEEEAQALGEFLYRRATQNPLLGLYASIQRVLSNFGLDTWK